MDTSKPLILVSNDDSVSAPGLRHLVDCISTMGRVVVVAPAIQHSGMSSAITCDAPLRVNLVETYHDTPFYSVTGTPVDCVKLALHTILKERPALMLSGINHGSNAGNSVIYSGTMGAAMEAAMNGIPAVGYSLLHHSISADFTPTTGLITDITRKVLANGLPEGTCLNINFPAKCEIEGLKVTRAARGYWTDEYMEYTDPHGRPYYWLAGRFVNTDPDDPETDEYWLARRWATAVPVRIDQSATDIIEAVRVKLQ